MGAPSQSYLAATGVAEDIARMERKALAALVPAMAAAQRELAADLQKWITKLGPNAAEQKFTAAKIRQVQILLGVAEARAGIITTGKTYKDFHQVAAQAVLTTMKQQVPHKLALQTLESQLDTLRAKFADLPGPQLVHAAFMAQGDNLVIDRFAKSANRYAGQVKDDLKLQFGIGLAKGETLQQLAKRIANLSGFQTAVDASHAPSAANAMAGGLTKRYKNWADRLVRTEMNNAYNYSAAKGIREAHDLDDRIMMVWDASLDKRVCDYCRTLHKTKAKPGGTFMHGLKQPPAHPNCRCAVVAWMDEWDDDAADDALIASIPSAAEVEAKQKQMEEYVDKATRRKEPEVAKVEKAAIEANNPTTIRSGKKAVKAAQAEAKAIPLTKADVIDGMESLVDARMLAARGVVQPAGVGVDKVKMDKARKAIAEGQRDAISIAVDSKGKLELDDGRHRFAAAVEANKPVKVKWYRGIDTDTPAALAPPPPVVSPVRAKMEKNLEEAKVDLAKTINVKKHQDLEWYEAFIPGEKRHVGGGKTYEEAVAHAKEKLADRLRVANNKLKELAEKEQRAEAKAAKAAGKPLPLPQAPTLKVGDPIPSGSQIGMLRRNGYVERNAEGRFVLNARGVAFFTNKHKEAEKKAAGIGLGTCQICDRECAIVRNLISLHGYNRPGTGFITGECRGSNRLPYEVSADAIGEWIAELNKMLAADKELLANFESKREFGIRVPRVGPDGKAMPDKIEFIQDDDPRFAVTKVRAHTELVNRIEALLNEIARAERRLAAWVPRKLGK